MNIDPEYVSSILAAKRVLDSENKALRVRQSWLEEQVVKLEHKIQSLESMLKPFGRPIPVFMELGGKDDSNYRASIDVEATADP